MEFSESEPWSNHEKEVTEKPVAHEKVTGKLVASRKSENSGNPKAEKKEMVTYVFSSCTSHGESVFDRKKILRPKSHGQLGRPRREHRFLVYIHEYHTSSSISSRSRLYGDFTIYQESTPEVCATVISK